jgi:GT2 family glycosyltransferase
MSEKESSVVFDNEHDVAIIIPTVGGEPLVGCLDRVVRNVGDKKVHVVVSLNPLDEATAEVTKALCLMATKNSPTKVTWEEAPRALGFGVAVNAGFDSLQANGGIPPMVIVLNDDTLPSPGWLDGMLRGMSATGCTAMADPDQNVLPIGDYGKVGIVGPVSNHVWRDQRVESGIESEMQIDAFAADYMEANKDYNVITEVISGFCMGLHRDLIVELIQNDGWVFDPIYSAQVGGFEDDDLCIRADIAGWRCLVAGDTYVHHLGSQTIGKMDIGKGLKNWPVHMRKWESHTQRDQTLAAVFRVKLETINDLFMFKSSLQGAANLCDSISILLTGDISALSQAIDLQALGGALEPSEVKLLEDSQGNDRLKNLSTFKAWVEASVADHWHSDEAGKVAVDKWDGFFNERDERNAALELSHQFEPDWIISIDHDEILEQRVDRAKIERLMKFPEPGVMAFDFAWMNHWNSPNHLRIDRPWGDGGDDKDPGSMRGWRMFRHNKHSPRKVLLGKPNGLHCGNIPVFSVWTTRVSNMRFHHFGYMRGIDRMRKARNYMEIDPDGERMSMMMNMLPYQHLVDETNMVLTPTPTKTGIAFSALCYEGEKPSELARVLNTIGSLCDSITLVWTDPNIEEPTQDFADVARLHKARWVRQKFEMDLSACRNAGLEVIEREDDEHVGWLFTLDLDEYFPNDFDNALALRRMADEPKATSWMFDFINSLGTMGGETERANSSMTMRMFRLRQGVSWNGKVHEGLSESMMKMRAEGIPAYFKRCSFKMLHVGLNQDPESIHRKLEKYAKMLVAEIEDNPDSCMPWCSLALHFLNDGQLENAMYCFNCSVHASGSDVWLPRREMGMQYLRMGKALLTEARDLCPEDNDYHEVATKVVQVLENMNVDHPFIGRSVLGQFHQSEVTEVPNVLPEALKEDMQGLVRPESEVG